MGKGKWRPAIDIKKAKKMLEKRDSNPDKRFSDDKQANKGIPTFVLNEYRQAYMDMQWKHDHGPPTAYCLLCKREAWSSNHIYSTMHLEKLLTRPYHWISDWYSVPDLEETGNQHPRTNGSAFPTVADEFYKTWPVLAYITCLLGVKEIMCLDLCLKLRAQQIHLATQMIPRQWQSNHNHCHNGRSLGS